MMRLGIGPMGGQVGGNSVNLVIQLFTGLTKLSPDIRQLTPNLRQLAADFAYLTPDLRQLAADCVYLPADSRHLGPEFFLPIRQNVGNEI